MTQLARQFEEHPEVRYGLTAMCIGIGMGGTVIWENPHHADYGKESHAVSDHTTDDLRRRAEAISPTRSSPDATCATSPCPGGAGTLALITLDNGVRPHQAQHVRPAAVAGSPLDAAHRRGAPTPARSSAVGVTGKPFIFAVGADLTGVAGGGRATQALEIARLGHARLPQARRRCRCRRSPSSTAPRWAAASRSRCTAPTARSSRRRAGARAARGVPRPGPRLGRRATCCPTSSAPRRPSRSSSRTR